MELVIEKTSRKIKKTSRKIEKMSRKIEKTSRKTEKTSRKIEKTSQKIKKTSRKIEQMTLKIEKTRSGHDLSRDTKLRMFASGIRNCQKNFYIFHISKGIVVKPAYFL